MTEDTLHYLMHCHHFPQYCFDLMNSVKSIIDSHLDNKKNKFILGATLNSIKNSERFSGSLFEKRFFLFFYLPSILILNLTTIYHWFIVHITYYYHFFTLFIDLYFNILIFPRQHKVLLGHYCMFLLFYLVFV